MKRYRFSPARLLAYQVLRDVAERDAYANLALQARMRDTLLSEQDAAFATELVSGTLRLAGRYDAVLQLVTGRETTRLDPEVHTVLRLGAHQLLSLDTPAHAAINEQVELAKHVAGQRTAGFVNGVLRTISRTETDEWLARISDVASSERERLAVVHSHPLWIVDALADALAHEGREAELEAALRSNNEAPKVQLAYVKGTPPEDAVGVSPIGDELASGNPARVIDELARDGVLAKVQDQGSQLAALALTSIDVVREGERWLDLCAGPGGKTAVLAAAAQRGGATLRANEISAHRAELVRRSIRGIDDVVTVVSHDGRKTEAFDGIHFDRIMVDAPCSGLGALRRRPEARWRKQASDVEDLAHLQHELLNAATAHLAPGGVLAYVTCSPHLAETRDVVAAHLRAHPELTELDAQATIEGIARTSLQCDDTSPGAAQLWPHRNGTDAMYISLMRRTDAAPSNKMTS